MHNFHEIAINDIHINDYVYIQRSGDVIPKIIGICHNKRPKDIIKITPPAKCPSCDTNVIQENIYIRCNNINCLGILENSIKLFTSKEGFDIVGFANQHIKLFIKHKFLKTYVDIFTLNKHYNEIITMHGWSTKSLQKLLTNIEKAKNIKLHKFISALGIHHIGINSAKLIAKKYQTIEKFINATHEELTSIKGLGIKSIKAVINYLTENQTMINELLTHINVLPLFDKLSELSNESQNFNSIELQDKKSSIFFDQNICITGTLSDLSRQKAFEILEELGAYPSTNITNKTDILVYTTTNSTKFKQAQKNKHIKLLNEVQFKTHLEQEIKK